MNKILDWLVSFNIKYRISINSFPDHKHLLQENYVEHKYIFFTITEHNF